jgi:tetratricopeptide (TPR) repeat protein
LFGDALANNDAVMANGDPKSLEAKVWAHLDRGEIKEAIASCENLNRQFPGFASGWHTSSQLALKLGNARMALDAVREALKLRPDYTSWLLQETRCLSKLGRTSEVQALVERLCETNINSAYECAGLGMLLTELGDRERALSYYEQAAKKQPDNAKHYFNLASLQRTLGRVDEAEQNFTKTIALNPQDFEAYKLRSELHSQTAEQNHVAELEVALKSGTGGKRGEAHICYALAKELEDMNESERSFHYLRQGADARRSLMKYDLGRDLKTMATIRETFTAEVFQPASEGDGSSEPVFILGMPRTGTTLVERILARHSDVYAAGELSNFAIELMKLVRQQAADGQQERDDLVRLSKTIDFGQLGRAYVESTRPFTGQTARFIDKLPLNYLYVGLIHLALPNAKIVNIRRNPMDTCYAVYKTLFADAYPFSYDLEELAKYYVEYDRLMKHWDSVLPGAVVHVINYEDLVHDVKAEARRLVEFCDLEWQAECLTYYESDEASTTASTVQVRKPVYQSSVGKWREYEEQLQPVAKILKDAGISVDG